MALLLVLISLANTGDASARSLIKLVKSEGPYYIDEGSQSSFSVSLLAPPNAPVTVTLAANDTFTSITTPAFHFDNDTWATPQSITVSATHDDVIRLWPYTAYLQLSTSSSDPDFGTYHAASGKGLRPMTFPVLIRDMNSAGAEVTIMTDISYPAALPEGRFANYALRLRSIPTSEVNVTLYTSPLLSVTPSFFEFSPATWNKSQEVHVVAVADNIVRPSPYTAEISFLFTSKDGNYSELSQPDLALLVQDTTIG